MLTIRQAQMQALEKAQVERFINELANHLHLAFSARFSNYSKDEMVTLSRNCCTWASDYGIDTEYDARRFAEFVASYGPDMADDHAWIGQTLRRDDISGEEKMNILDNVEVQFIGLSS